MQKFVSNKAPHEVLSVWLPYPTNQLMSYEGKDKKTYRFCLIRKRYLNGTETLKENNL